MKLINSCLVIFLFTAVSYNAAARGHDLKIMTKARLYFEKGSLDKAYANYDMISRSSDFWLEAMEEKAQVMARKKEYASALALLQTVLSPTFDGIVGPEPYLLTALIQLKTCDYSSVFKTSQLFKERFKKRTQALHEIENSASSSAVTEFIKKLSSQPLDFSSLGALAKELPRNIQRDQLLQKQSFSTKTAIRKRIKNLAQEELSEIENIVNKLQIVEAEAIHHIYLAENSEIAREKQGKIASGADVMTFPYKGEVWLDEIGNYSASIEKCSTTVTNKKASL
ncbi:MAG: hypothetical protein A2Z20_12890 [Bdellovibrionales bacterium RBG_16_40_8]|nr:MAG: hypothetical protein A2Z20_12890 [Bdellovibrionales bacterium RBG_16_40_8]